MQNKVLNGLVYEICEIYIDDVLIHGKTDTDFLTITRRMFERLCAKKVAVNSRKTKLGLKEVEYVGHLVSATGTSFTPEDPLKVLDFSQPSTQNEMLQFLGLVNYFRDHMPNMTEMVKPLRDMIPQGKYQRTSKLVRTIESSAARQARLDNKLSPTVRTLPTPVLQTDASDYGIDGYLYMVTNGKVQVIRLFSKALVGPQLNWSTREYECYGIYFAVKTFEDLLDNRRFILKTDHMNLTYLNVTLTGKVHRWKIYLQDKDFYLCHVPGKEVHQFVPDVL